MGRHSQTARIAARPTLVIGAVAAMTLSPLLGGFAFAAPDRDCGSFSSQAEAQAALQPGDPERLDANDNGIACESYDYANKSGSVVERGQTQIPRESVPTGGADTGDGSFL